MTRWSQQALGMSRELALELGQGVRVEGGAYYVPSRSRPGEVYRVDVTADGRLLCNCAGFEHRGRCWHVSYLKEENMTTTEPTQALVPIRLAPPPSTLPTEREMTLIAQAAGWALAGAVSLPRELNSPEKVAAVMLAGWELGLKPMTAIRHLYIVDGRVQPSAELMAGLFQRQEPQGRLEVVGLSETECTMRIVRPSRGVDARYTVTMHDVERAGLSKREGWLRYPKDRLRWHCTKRILRIYAPDAINALEAIELASLQPASDGEPEDALYNEGDTAKPSPPQEPPITEAQRDQIKQLYPKRREAHAELRRRWPHAFPEPGPGAVNKPSALTEAEAAEVIAVLSAAPAKHECQHEPVYDEQRAVKVCAKCGIALEGPGTQETLRL
jgi:hypothetical protein